MPDSVGGQVELRGQAPRTLVDVLDAVSARAARGAIRRLSADVGHAYGVPRRLPAGRGSA